MTMKKIDNSSARFGFFILSWAILFFLVLPGKVLAQSNDAIAEMTDFDNDGTGDLILYDPASAQFIIRGSATGGFGEVPMGSVGDVPGLGDFDADGKADLATFNRSTVEWNIKFYEGDDVRRHFGNIGDIPVPGYYNTTDCAELATYNSRTSRWMIRQCRSPHRITQFFIGPRGAVPVPADYDCDGKTDAAVFDRKNRQWIIRKSSTGEYFGFYFGLYFDIPIPADFVYERKDCAQPALFRPTSKHFFVAGSIEPGSEVEPRMVTQWGLEGDLPGLFNVDEDGKADFSVFRPENSTFYIQTSRDFLFAIPFPLDPQELRYPEARIGAPFEDQLPEIPPTSVPMLPTSSQFVSYPAKGDYDGDRRSDMAFVRVERELYRSIWSVMHRDGTTSMVQVNAPADALVPGDYNGDGRTQPAVVYVNSGLPPANNLEWHIKNPDGTEMIRYWGKNGDRPIVGDFDCDGKDDIAVTREELGGVFWYMWFSSPRSTPVGEYLFGLAGDRVYTADFTGDGCDDLVVSREEGEGITWFYQSLGDTTYNRVPWGLRTDALLTPADIDGDSVADLIVARPNGIGSIDFYIKRSREGAIIIPFGFHGDVIMTGDYSGSGLSELAVYRRSEESYYLRKTNGEVPRIQFGTADDIIVRPDGSTVNPGEGKVGAGPDPIGPGCDETLDFVDGGGGALWKPHSENTGKPVFLLPSEYWNMIVGIEVLDSGGNLIVNGRNRTCCPNGGRAHYDVPMHASRLEDYAPITVKLYMRNGTTECRTVPDPERRYD